MATDRPLSAGLTWPNLLTGMRIVLIPVFGMLWLQRSALALVVLAVAAAPALLDGITARVLHQESQLGRLLDPVADKLLVLVAIVVGLQRGVVPVWFAAIVLGRDALLVLGSAASALFWRRRFGPRRWVPSLVGKAAMLLQALVLITIAIYDLVPLPGLGPHLPALLAVPATFAIVSGLQYVMRAAQALRNDTTDADAPLDASESTSGL